MRVASPNFDAAQVAPVVDSESETSVLCSGIERTSEGVVLLERGDSTDSLRIRYANPAFCRELGSQQDSRSLCGRGLCDVLPSETHAALADARALEQCLQFAIDAPSGSRQLCLRFSPIQGSPEAHEQRWFGFLREMQSETDRTRLDRERLAAVARLAAGLLHEVNNPLASVTTNLEWLAAALPGLGASTIPGNARAQTLATVSAALVDALTGAERVETSIENLSLLSGINYAARELLDLRVVLDASVSALEPLFGHDIQIERDYVDELPLVYASERRLRQAFVSILTNAAQSLERTNAPRTITLRILQRDALVVQIEDNGAGIAPEHRAQLFQPFFSTKPAGIGKGVGLYLARTIIEANGGRIGFTPAAPAGACFWIELPRAAAQTGETVKS